MGKPWTEAASARPKLIAITVASWPSWLASLRRRRARVPQATCATFLFVGNNWDGTATVVRPLGDFAALGEVNIIPDIDERMLEIATNPERLGYFLAVRELIGGEGHDQFVDDMFTSNDGRLLIVSRPSLADVVGIDLATDEIAWRFPMTGQRSDHMGLSLDGKLVAVSDSTAKRRPRSRHRNR